MKINVQSSYPVDQFLLLNPQQNKTSLQSEYLIADL